MPEKKRILTGTRPTGPLHLGHNAGALENWLELQSEYDCYFLIADYQDSDFMQMTFDAFVTKWYPVRETLEHGIGRARAIARETMEMLHDALDLDCLRKSR